jgi:hypothetical protein
VSEAIRKLFENVATLRKHVERGKACRERFARNSFSRGANYEQFQP